MVQHRVPILAVLLVTTGLAGCIGADAPVESTTTLTPKDTYDTARGWSMPTTPAAFEMLEGLEVRVPSFDGTEISMGLFRPDIEGCDWEASDLPDHCQLPVVMDAGPYYGANVDQDKYRPPIIEWLVPRGYVVVQMSVRGTGESGGCMEFFSVNEQKDVDAMVTWLAEQPWSNGNVGMMGRSYDGSTPLMAAALGNPHLKTIVPISGVPDFEDLMFKNGTSEFRGPIMHSYVYWANFGIGAVYGPSAAGFRADHWAEQACTETVVGQTEGGYAMATGDTDGVVDENYWSSRDFQQAIIDNYQGSIWVIHGMEDWNVNPSQVVPWIAQLKDAGIPTAGMLGVWGHAYPDRVDEHRNVRWDWAQRVVEWMDFYLKGEGEQPSLMVEVEDRQFIWRTETTYPPEDIEWANIEFHGGAIAAERGWSMTTEPFEDDVRIAGLPRLHFEAIPTTTTGGYVFAEIYDVFPDGRSVRLGWGAIDLRHHAGGNNDPQALQPFEPVIAKMEFEPTDGVIAEGHALRLVMHKDGVQDIIASPDPSVVLIGQSTLSLPTIEREGLLAGYAAPGLAMPEA